MSPEPTTKTEIIDALEDAENIATNLYEMALKMLPVSGMAWRLNRKLDRVRVLAGRLEDEK